MTSLSDLSGWAGRIIENMPSGATTVGRIASWLQNNIYRVNTTLVQFPEDSFYWSGDYLVPDMNMNISGIYEEMYYCDYMRKQAMNLVGAAAYDWSEIQGEDQGTIRRVSKNEQAKTYRTLCKDCEENIASLINWYNTTYSTGELACQVLYSERLSGSNTGLLPLLPPSYLYSYNTIWT